MDVEKVSKAITYLRKRAGYTQKELAERLGISDKAVSKWERGLGLPDISSLRKLSILLDTDTDSLLAGDVIHHDSGWCGVLLLDRTTSGVDLRTVVYDKPLAHFLLSYFLLVGIKRILVVCSEEERLFLEKEFGDGSLLGIHLYYGSADVETVLAQHAELRDCSNYMIVHGRSFIYGVDQTRFFQRAMIYRDRLTVLSLPRGNKASRRRLVFDTDKKIVCADETEELSTQYDYYDIPVVFCPRKMFTAVCKAITEGSVAGHSGLQDGCLYTEVLDRGFVEISIDTWEDVQDASGFVKIVERACGMKLYCLEEIAWRRGMITTERLKALARQQADEEYCDYLLALCGAAENG